MTFNMRDIILYIQLTLFAHVIIVTVTIVETITLFCEKIEPLYKCFKANDKLFAQNNEK